MKNKIRNIKYKLAAIWWLITRKNYYLLAYNSREGRSLESFNVVLPEFITWVQKKHGMMTRKDIMAELKEIDYCLIKPKDILAYNMIKDLYEKLKNEENKGTGH